MQGQKIAINLPEIQKKVQEKQAENDVFRGYLTGMDPQKVDALVTKLNTEIEPLVDCTACGNCCKSLMIVVEEKEADTVANYLAINRAEFDNRYLEKGANGMMLINTIPCHFLSQNKCTIYNNRFAGCREFPALHIAGINKRLFTIFMHYDRCPIIYNVFELLKKETGFTKS